MEFMKSIDVFNITSMEIMRECLSVFPAPAQIQTQVISDTVNSYFIEVVSTNEKCLYTVKWLLNENFLIDNGSNVSFFRLTLCQKGLNAINSFPSAISEKRSVASYIEDGISKVSVGMATIIMAAFFKNGS
jgi:hypothetical protein